VRRLPSDTAAVLSFSVQDSGAPLDLHSFPTRRSSDLGIWWFTLRNRWDPGARYMPAAQPALRRQTSKVGAGCGNAARPVLCGGCSVMGITTRSMGLLTSGEFVYMINAD